LNEKTGVLKTRVGNITYHVVPSNKTEQEKKDEFYKFLAEFLIRNIMKKEKAAL
jgi:hypothetical protein